MLTYLEQVFSEIIAVEPSLPAIRAIETRTRGRFQVIKSKAESIPLADGTVDVVFSKSSFHHFESMPQGLREMCRVARNAVAIVEVIAPSAAALRFAETLLPQKEPSRPKFAVFSESSLKRRVSRLTREVRCLHFDQYIDVSKWLMNSDLNRQTRLRIYDHIAAQTGEIRDDMHIHYRKQRLVMLRRMALVIGFLPSHR